MSKISAYSKYSLLALAIAATSCSKDGISPVPDAQSHSNDATVNVPLYTFTPDSFFFQPPFYTNSVPIDGNKAFGFYWSLTQSIGYQYEWPMADKVTIHLFSPEFDDLNGNHTDGYDQTFKNVYLHQAAIPEQHNGYRSAGVVLYSVKPGSYQVTISSEPDANGQTTSLFAHDNLYSVPTTTIINQLTLQ